MSVPITLTAAEIMQACTVGAMRQADSMAKGRKEAYGADGDPLYKHILGAAGEIAVARVIGRYWGGDVGTFKSADIGRNIQVRTRSKHDWDLLVRPDANDDDVYVLVTGCPTHLVVRGWMKAARAKAYPLKPHGGRPPAHFVPQADLCTTFRRDGA